MMINKITKVAIQTSTTNNNNNNHTINESYGQLYSNN